MLLNYSRKCLFSLRNFVPIFILIFPFNRLLTRLDLCRLKLKKDGNPSKQQELKFRNNRKHKDILHANNINSNKTSNEFTYIMEVPTFTFDIYGKTVKGATDIRKLIADPEIDNTRILNILYNREEPHPELYKMIEENIIESQKKIS